MATPLPDAERNSLSKGKPCIDHLGNEYPSVKEMCRKYDLNYNMFCARVKRGWTIEEAVLGRKRHGSVCCDHLGNKYPSIKALCEAYGISIHQYRYRWEAGWSVESILMGEQR